MSNDNRQCAVHAVLFALSFGLLSVAAAEDTRSIPVGQRQLFLNDDAIARIEHPDKGSVCLAMIWSEP